MSNEFGDPNRQYGIPGIDNQVPGSAAQAAGISAYQSSKKSGGSDSQATQAAVNAAAQSIQTNPANIPAGGPTAAQQLTVAESKAGTYEPTSAGVSPSLIQAAWIEGLLGNKPQGSQGQSVQQPAAPAAGNITVNVSPSSPTVASDGQSLSSQSAAIQSQFEAAYGALASQVWAAQHNDAIGMPSSSGGGTTTVNVSNPSQGTSTGGPGAATAVPASLDASLAGISGWVQANPVQALVGGGLLMWLFGGKRR